MSFLVCWIDGDGVKGQGTPWQDRDMAQRYAEYAQRFARGRRRYWVEFGKASDLDMIAANPFERSPVPGRILTPESLGYMPLFQ